MYLPGYIINDWYTVNVYLTNKKFYFQKDMKKNCPDGVLNFDFFHHHLKRSDTNQCVFTIQMVGNDHLF